MAYGENSKRFAEEIKDKDIMILSGNLPILTGFGHQMHQLCRIF
jgi:hypothetical protein